MYFNLFWQGLEKDEYLKSYWKLFSLLLSFKHYPKFNSTKNPNSMSAIQLVNMFYNRYHCIPIQPCICTLPQLKKF